MFKWNHQLLQIDQVDITDLANRYGTPLYIYSHQTLKEAWNNYYDVLKDYPHKICYAVKANSNLAILNEFFQLGAGFDIVSEGEFVRVLAAGGNVNSIVFSGVGKQINEIKMALEKDIYCFNIESVNELQRISKLAQQMNKVAPIALRVNPDVDAKTHPYISTGLKENKFGIEIDEAYDLYQIAAKDPHIKIKGIAYHIGSQIIDISPFGDALDRVLQLVDKLHTQGIYFEHIDIGGGLGVNYLNEIPPAPQDYLKPLLQRLKPYGMTIIVEPGRSLIANAGILITKVEYIKHCSDKNFAIVDAAMNDLIRPSIYNAWHDIIPIQIRNDIEPCVYDVVGPICETGDFLGKERLLQIQSSDLLAIKTVGAYGFSMSSNYNSRPRAAEILIKDNKAHLIRQRETITDLFSLENIV
ncbi:MAG: Diaminopimelate decarboxylase [Legionellaceae bacterium]